jgi:hypothetical protein
MTWRILRLHDGRMSSLGVVAESSDDILLFALATGGTDATALLLHMQLNIRLDITKRQTALKQDAK